MTGRSSPGPLVLVVLALAAAVGGCRSDRTPRRVPDDGAPCSAIMPGAAKSGEGSIRLGDAVVIERSWFRQPSRVLPPEVDTPKDIAIYVVRRGGVPSGSALRDSALLDAVAARAARGIALQDGTKPGVAKVASGAGDAVELRWATGTLHNASWFLLVPDGYCEVTILRAQTDAVIAAYFASVQVRP